MCLEVFTWVSIIMFTDSVYVLLKSLCGTVESKLLYLMYVYYLIENA